MPATSTGTAPGTTSLHSASAAEFDSNYFWGYLKPGVDFTATLRRLGEIIATYVGKSSANNYYSGGFYHLREPHPAPAR